MVEQGVLSADQLSRAIAERYGLDHVDLNIYHVDMGAANLVSVQTARRFHAVPVGYVDPETLLVAMSDPANVLAVDDMQMMTGLNCRVAVAAEVDIEALISRLNSLETRGLGGGLRGRGGGRTSAPPTSPSCASRPTTRRSSSSSTRSSARRSTRAPPTSTSRSRTRTCASASGSTASSARPPACRGGWSPASISRIKIMSELDIAEKRVPQDGRVAVNVNDRRVDLRVVTVPTERGEGATIRILDKTEAIRTLDELGLFGEAADPASSRPTTRPTARSSSPGRPAPASRRRCIRRCRSSTASTRTSSRSRTRSSTRCPASTRWASTARPGSTSPSACARSSAPTPT